LYPVAGSQLPSPAIITMPVTISCYLMPIGYIFTWKCSVPRVEVKEIMTLVQGDADGRLNKKLVFKYSH